MFWKSISFRSAVGHVGIGFLIEDVERAQAELEHPLRLLLVGRDLLDDLAIQAALRLERRTARDR